MDSSDPGAARPPDAPLVAVSEAETAPDESVTLGAALSTPDSTPAPPAEVPLIHVAARGGGGDFEVRRLLGRGAMGQVHLAWQRSVGREVAIKVPLFGEGRAARTAALLREARVTGRLEHPNVVPMHGLGQTPDGSTVMVMKRVEGVAWRRAIDDPEQMPERFRGPDVLAAHLRVLMEVCDAVHFAHRRGVLHRDIKPDNVLLGAFGEVYLVDWGLAVALADDGTGHLPLASAVDQIAGTPGYMAPEMARGDGARLGPASDVFCLGATLHRLLVGTPLHTGATLGEVLAAARRAAPFDYRGRGLPGALVDICACATAADPAARFPDVAAFRQALADALEHRAAFRLVVEARLAQTALRAARDEGAAEDVDRHFGAARFALEHALRIRPGDREAREALDGLLLDRAEIAMQAGLPDHAEQLAEAVAGDGGPRAARLAAGLAAHRHRQQRLARQARETDLAVFARQRALLLVLLAVVVLVNNLRRALDPPTVERLLADQIWMGLGVGALTLAGRRWLWSTAINRRLTLSLWGFLIIDTAARATGWRLGLGPHPTTAIELVGDLAGLLFLTFLGDPRLLPVVAIWALATAAALLDPSIAFYAKGSASLVALSGIAAVWLWGDRRDQNQSDGMVA